MRARLAGINHVALQVDDLEAAVAFYTALFEPTAVDRSEEDAAFLEIGDQFLALFERGSREEEPHFGLVVQDKEAARRALQDAGVEILPGHRLDFRDPSGNRVQIVQYDQIQFTKPDHILEAMGLSPEKSCGPPTGGRIPMAGSVNPKVGPTWAVVGDAAGSTNPFNGEGIDYAYETGRMVAGLLDEAITTGDGLVLQRYPKLLDDEYGLYFKVARLFSKLIGQPALMRQLTLVGMQSRSLMDWVLRIMANLLNPDELGPAEAAYKMAAAIVRLVPEPGT